LSKHARQRTCAQLVSQLAVRRKTEPPAQLHIIAAVDLESDVPTVVLGGDPSETWLVFETSPLGEE